MNPKGLGLNLVRMVFLPVKVEIKKMKVNPIVVFWSRHSPTPIKGIGSNPEVGEYFELNDLNV